MVFLIIKVIKGILAARKKDRETVSEKGGTADFDKKIECYFASKQSKAKRDSKECMLLHIGESMKQASKRAGNVLFNKVIDSKI
ncbi:MAG: hypothetical protein MTP17_03685 [Candidatus Midichloria sp.]|nr:MAG: hypothetical protein MTP17_03685 [Candidatus Midichloria sp.]